jgi:hypothetical protein
MSAKSAGQLIDGGFGVGVGWTDEPPQPAAIATNPIMLSLPDFTISPFQILSVRDRIR